jgi:trans-aconitate methyltransferase
MPKKLDILSANKKAFEREYWGEMYLEDEESVIDGLFNAKGHARYAKALFKFMELEVRSLGDFGFGLGVLLKEFVKVFQPKQIIAIDPSHFCVQKLVKKKWIQNQNIAIVRSNFHDFDTSHLEENPLDLVIVNSVLQYFPNKDFEFQVSRLSKICRYLYITLPTKKDYKKMRKDFDFTDPYAYERDVQYYRKAFQKHFDIVSYNLMESKLRVEDTPFLYEFFRH